MLTKAWLLAAQRLSRRQRAHHTRVLWLMLAVPYSDLAQPQAQHCQLRQQKHMTILLKMEHAGECHLRHQSRAFQEAPGSV